MIKDVEKNKALGLVKKINKLLEQRKLDVFSLIETKTDGRYLSGYTVYVKSFMSNVFKIEAKDIAEKEGFRMKEEDGQIIFFKPSIQRNP
jgi:hypothetical protein